MNVPPVSQYVNIIHFHCKSYDIIQKAINFEVKGRTWLGLWMPLKLEY